MRRAAIFGGVVVSLILGVYAAASWLQGMHDVQREKREQATRELAQAKQALMRFLSDGRRCEELLSTEGLAPRYLERAPLDPWGRPYVVRCAPPPPAVGTLGADGREGGEGPDADLFAPPRN